MFDPTMLVTALLAALALILVVAGIAGLLVPAMPGAPLIFAGLFVAAWAEGFEQVGATSLVIVAVLGFLTYPADLLAAAVGAKRFGASKRAAVGAAVGSVIGIFFGLPGILLGPFVGAVVVELSDRRALREVGLSGIGATVGLVLGVAAKMALAFAMIGVFVLARLA